jgi:hypothetical protein
MILGICMYLYLHCFELFVYYSTYCTPLHINIS